MRITVEQFVTAISLSLAVFSVIYAVLVNRATTRALREIRAVATSIDQRSNQYLSRIIESNPQLVAASAKKDFMEFLVANPDMIKALTIRPGGMIILSSVFEAKFSKAEFNRQVAELFRMQTEQEFELLKQGHQANVEAAAAEAKDVVHNPQSGLENPSAAAGHVPGHGADSGASARND